MDESAKKGLERKRSDHAEIPKRQIRRFRERPKAVAMDEWAIKAEELSDSYAGSNVIRRMVVKGYDTSPPRDDVEGALRKHFASCGIYLIHASVPAVGDFGSDILCSHALVYVNEEFEEEALKLQGSDMGGGYVLEITAYPFDDNSLDSVFVPLPKPMTNTDSARFDASLDEDDITRMVREIFPVCSTMVMNDGFCSTVFLHLHGQDIIDKALKLSGGSVGNSNIAVTSVLPRRRAVRAGLSLADRLALAD